MGRFKFEASSIGNEYIPLRQEVRNFIKEYFANNELFYLKGMVGFDKDFSTALAEKGWIGMTWPKQYGGHEKSAIERYVVVEELLTAGAPLTAHWIGDRQSGPLLLNLGTEEQKQFYVPKIAKGEITFCIGLSEPNSGSDLASVKTKAAKVDGGYLLNGSKIWTSNAHVSDYMIGLFRTSFDKDKPKHSGLSQLIVDLKLPGIEIRPIRDMAGDVHFNEVFFTDVFVENSQLIGQEGDGWRQVTSELAFERSQPDRFLSCYVLLKKCLDELQARGCESRDYTVPVGKCISELTILREMSLSILAQLMNHESPAQEAALVKELGNTYEQSIPVIVREMLDIPAYKTNDQSLSDIFYYLTLASPSFSLRGGTKEILRGIIAKSLGVK